MLCGCKVGSVDRISAYLPKLLVGSIDINPVLDYVNKQIWVYQPDLTVCMEFNVSVAPWSVRSLELTSRWGCK